MAFIKILVGGDVAAVLPVLLAEYHLHQIRQFPLTSKSHTPANKDFPMPILPFKKTMK